MIPFRTTKVLLLISALLALAIAVAYGVLWFAFIKERARISGTLASLSDAERESASYRSIAQLLSETAEKRARIDSFFVNKDGAVSFIKEIEQVGASAGIKTDVIKIAVERSAEEDADSAKAGIEKFAAAIEASGSFEGVYRFLALLEKIPRPLLISHVSFSQNENGVWGGVFEISVSKLK